LILENGAISVLYPRALDATNVDASANTNSPSFIYFYRCSCP
jgi:hypothetical protein